MSYHTFFFLKHFQKKSYLADPVHARDVSTYFPVIQKKIEQVNLLCMKFFVLFGGYSPYICTGMKWAVAVKILFSLFNTLTANYEINRKLRSLLGRQTKSYHVLTKKINCVDDFTIFQAICAFHAKETVHIFKQTN